MKHLSRYKHGSEKRSKINNASDWFYRQHFCGLYRVSQELRSLLRDLIPDLILSQKLHIHVGPIRNSSGVTSF